MIPRLTKEQAAIVGAYTGFAAGNFADIQEYAERVLARPVWTHEFASKPFNERLREAARPDFLALCHQEEPEPAPR